MCVCCTYLHLGGWAVVATQRFGGGATLLARSRGVRTATTGAPPLGRGCAQSCFECTACLSYRISCLRVGGEGWQGGGKLGCCRVRVNWRMSVECAGVGADAGGVLLLARCSNAAPSFHQTPCCRSWISYGSVCPHFVRHVFKNLEHPVTICGVHPSPHLCATGYSIQYCIPKVGPPSLRATFVVKPAFCAIQKPRHTRCCADKATGFARTQLNNGERHTH